MLIAPRAASRAMADPAMRGVRPKLKTQEDKLHYISERIDRGKMIIRQLDEQVDHVATLIAELVEMKTDAMDELRKHIDGGDEKVLSEGEKNPSLHAGLQNYAGTLDGVASLESMQVGRLRNVQLELQSFPNYARRAQVQLAEFTSNDESMDRAKKEMEAAKGRNSKILHDNHIKSLAHLGERAEGALIRETQEFEGVRVRMLRKTLGDLCHLNMEYHARSLAKFCEAAADAALIEPQEIEEVVGLQESRPAQTDTELFVQMLTALKEEQLPPGEEMKRKQKIHGMVFVTAS